MPSSEAVRAGLIAGAVTIYLALVGLIERFSDLNLVGTQVTFARLALIAAPFVARKILKHKLLEALAEGAS